MLEEFEEAMLSSMRLPFLFQQFDTVAENVTIKILKALGRFEQIDNLPRETASSILLNDALRQKMSSEPNVDKQFELVKEAMIEENKIAKETLTATNEKTLLLEDRVKFLEQQLKEKDENEKRTRDRKTYIIRWIFTPTIATIIIALRGAHILISKCSLTHNQSVLLLLLLGLFITTLLAAHQGRKSDSVIKWAPFRRLIKFKKRLLFIIGTLLLGHIINITTHWTEKLLTLIWK